MASAREEIQAAIDDYMARPYRIELIPDRDEGGFVARVPDLPGCMSQGETADEAVEMIHDAMRGWLAVSLEHGDPVPEPRRLGNEDYSG
jgi:predicted RNase H-like HicB family nuclease